MNRIKNTLKKLHADDAGEMPVGPMLVIGLIVIPLIVILMAFRDELDQEWQGWVGQLW